MIHCYPRLEKSKPCNIWTGAQFCPAMCLNVKVYNSHYLQSDDHDILQNEWVTVTFH